MIRNARRQARRRGLIPCRHAGAARELANLVFGEARLVERAQHAELARGLAPGPIVAAIVRVAAVDDRRDAAARAIAVRCV